MERSDRFDNGDVDKNDQPSFGQQAHPPSQNKAPQDSGTSSNDYQKFCKLQTFRLSVAICVFIAIAYVFGRLGVSWVTLLVLCVLAILQWQDKFLDIQKFAYREAEIQEHRKKAFASAETVEWLNFFLNRWWTFSDRTLFQLLKNSLDPTLEACKPNIIESIELTDFTLGSRTPFIKYVRIYDTTDDLRKIMANEVVFRQPPPDIVVRPKYQVVVDADIALDAPDSKVVLATKLKLGNSDVCIEGLQIRGRMQLNIQFNQNIPFPHIAALSFCFLKEPKFNFQVRLLKKIELMQYPLIRDWICNLVNDGLKYSMVDPGRVTIPLCSDPEVLGRRSGYAHGVLTLTIKGGKKSSGKDFERWCSVTLGKQKIRTKEMGVDVVWQDSVSLFVDSIQYDKLRIKIKEKRRFGPNFTIVEYVLPLARINIQQEPIQDLDLENKDIEGSLLQVHLEYTELPLLDVSNETDYETFDKNFLCKVDDGPPEDVAGILFVRVHKGTNLIPMDPDGLSDPYCMIFANKDLCHITHVIEDTLNPEWDSMTEFFTADYTQTTLSFIINDRNPVMFSTSTRADDNDDFMGSCNLALTASDWLIFKRDVDVFFKIHKREAFGNENFNDRKVAGSICVSVIFRPVPSLLKSIKPSKSAGFPEGESLTQKHAKMDAVTMEALLCAERGSLTLKLHRARNLVAMDLNGKSDPFIIVRVGQAKTEKYKTKICYRTLNPVWNEEITFAMPDTHERVFIEVWDKDPFTNERMGHVSLDHHLLKDISKRTVEKKEWYRLKKVKCGEIQLTVTVSLPAKVNEPEKILKKDPAVKAYSLTSNDYIMLDFMTDKEENTEKSQLSIPSYPSDNGSSSEADLLPRKRPNINEESPQIDSRRVVVSSSASKLNNKNNNAGYAENLKLQNKSVQSDASPNQKDDVDFSAAEISPSVKESGVVDLSRDPVKYNGLKGQLLGLTDLTIPKGITSISVRMRLDKHPRSKRTSFFSSPFILCKTDFLLIDDLSQINQAFSTKADHGFAPVTYLWIEVKDNRKDIIDSGSITLSNLFKGENPAKRVVDLDNGGKMSVHICYEEEDHAISSKRNLRARGSIRY
eukprot:gene17602-19355_t